MPKPKKSFTEKLNQHEHAAKVVVIEKPFAGFPPGAKLLISSPKEVKSYIDQIPRGETRSPEEFWSGPGVDMRLELSGLVSSGWCTSGVFHAQSGVNVPVSFIQLMSTLPTIIAS